MVSRIGSLLALSTALLMGCSGRDFPEDDVQRVGGADAELDDTDAELDDTLAPSTCPFEAAHVSVTVGEQATLTDGVGSAMNTMEIDTLSPVPDARMGALRAGPCGTVGVVYRQGTELRYHELAGDGAGQAPEVVTSGSEPGLGFSLFYEDDCTPIVTLLQSGQWNEFRRQGESWVSRSTGLDLLALTGSSSVAPFASKVDAAGEFHLFGDGLLLVHGRRSAAPGSSWTWEARPMPVASTRDDYAVDRAGTLHALFRNTQYPCADDCDVSLYHGTLAIGSDTWQVEVALQGVWGPPLDEYIGASSLTVDSQDRLVFAGHFLRRVETGSIQSSELRLGIRAEGDYCLDTAVTTNGTFQGSDGAQFTGASPVIAIDEDGVIHTLFLDQAIWHDGNGYANEMQGAPRHAVLGSRGWVTTQLADQVGQTQSAQPLWSAGQPQIACSSEGNSAHVVFVERSWDTPSIYNSSSQELEFRLVHLPLTWP